jgi:zinc transporter 5/7
MVVEALYGYWSNSLGLMSDAAHMCFDATALAIGLYASYVSKFPPDEDYSYGYLRYEVLSGLINGIFLVFVGFSVFVESIERIMEPPEINSEQLILVSVLGLGINALGLCFFHDHSHDHEENDSNLHGVFLHILADALGSVGVITSSIIVSTLEWYVADPICSLVISLLIFMSVGPLLTDSVKVLMQRDVGGKTKKLRKALAEIEGVDAVEKMHVWKLAGDQYVLTAVLNSAANANPLSLTQSAKSLCEQLRIHNAAIQVHSAFPEEIS